MSELNERILDCPDCENQGWYVVENLKTGEPLQEQCKFCGTEERSVFNIVTKLEAKNAVQEDRIIDLINCNKVMQSECDELESRVKHIEAKEDIKDRVLMPRELTAENIFAIQSDMATAIADALQATLLPREVARLNEIPTQSTRAYDFYLTGNDYLRRIDSQYSLTHLAVEAYSRAVEEDPNFALAWANLSRAHSNMFWYRFDRSELRLSLALEAVQNAFQLAPDLPVESQQR